MYGSGQPYTCCLQILVGAWTEVLCQEADYCQSQVGYKRVSYKRVQTYRLMQAASWQTFQAKAYNSQGQNT